ncbi:hypothetical protein EG328_003235 [Venturia inaequalis]|uniref:Uncharacterized protein n=1 Tax=Venturia inaequalis TaxID=5025 RepID=A0A8H3US81_VENIN|nr:hypothetical protein EG328_003235 [Venturia inaequalis]
MSSPEPWNAPGKSEGEGKSHFYRDSSLSASYALSLTSDHNATTQDYNALLSAALCAVLLTIPTHMDHASISHS